MNFMDLIVEQASSLADLTREYYSVGEDMRLTMLESGVLRVRFPNGTASINEIGEYSFTPDGTSYTN